MKTDNKGLSRRFFLKSTAALGALALIPSRVKAICADVKTYFFPPKVKVDTGITVNNRLYQIKLDSRTTLLDYLREEISLPGTKKGCDHGQCGACTVHVDGERMLSCLTLTATCQGKHITTIEGISDGEELHPMQSAFLACDGFQCGYCTPGQIMSAIGCVKEGHTHSVEEIKEYMSGNLCRCGAYNGIVESIQKVATR